MTDQVNKENGRIREKSKEIVEAFVEVEGPDDHVANDFPWIRHAIEKALTSEAKYWIKKCAEIVNDGTESGEFYGAKVLALLKETGEK